MHFAEFSRLKLQGTILLSLSLFSDKASNFLEPVRVAWVGDMVRWGDTLSIMFDRMFEISKYA